MNQCLALLEHLEQRVDVARFDMPALRFAERCQPAQQFHLIGQQVAQRLAGLTRGVMADAMRRGRWVLITARRSARMGC